MTSTSPDFQAYEARLAAARALAATQAPANRTALFDALATAGIHTVVVMFDGAGDQGQFESAEAFGADNAVLPMPAGPIAFGVVAPNWTHIEHDTRSVREVIEAMVHEFLDQTYDGWEDGDGAYGQFNFTMAGRTIELEYNERRMDSDNHHHEL